MTWLDRNSDSPGGTALQAMLRYAVLSFGFNLDEFVQELTEAM